MIDLRAHLAPTRKELERFGILFFAVMSVIGGLLYWRGSHSWPAFALAAAVFLAMRLTMPLAFGTMLETIPDEDFGKWKM